jgi:hypothetical protein
MMTMTRQWMTTTMCGLALAATCLTGCQVEVGGQMLPSAYYLSDDVQYFAPGTENKLSRENAAMKAYRADQAVQGRSP